MIEVKNINKAFDDKEVLKDVNLEFEKGYIYGVVGSNGAGKSTLLRIMSGVYNPSCGEVLYDNVALDTYRIHTPSLVFLSDNIYYDKGATIKSLAREYNQYYSKMSFGKLKNILGNYKLNIKEKITNLSKGQKNQMRIAIALACNTDYILLDETLDGLDPLVRVNTKKIIYNEIANTDKTVILTSHSLREMEDMCDYIIILHDSRILLCDGVENMKQSYVKLRCAFSKVTTSKDFSDIDIVTFDGKKIVTIVAKGEKSEVLDRINANDPLMVEEIPLSLEEVFLINMNELGYDELVFEEEAKDEK